MCESATPSNILVNFQKSVYMPNEVAVVGVNIDNSMCKKNLINMVMSISQNFTMSIGGHAFRAAFNLAS